MSNFRVETWDVSQKDIWDDFVDEADGGTLFHKYDWLLAAKQHTGYELVPLTVHQGNKLVCVFPVFLVKMMSVNVVLSPPNGCAIPHLGPVISLDTNKQHNVEKGTQKIIEEVYAYLKSEYNYDYIRIICSPAITDVRPLKWNNFSITPMYTYHLDLNEDESTIFNNFDKRVKRRIRKAESNEQLTVSNRPLEEMFVLLKLVKERYKEQGENFKVSETYLQKLMNSSVAGNINVKIGFENNEAVTGMLLLKYKNSVHNWIGGINPNSRTADGINELLIWDTINEYSRKQYHTYELMGADTEQLCDHKSKYNPALVSHFLAEKATLKGQVALKLQQLKR